MTRDTWVASVPTMPCRKRAADLERTRSPQGPAPLLAEAVFPYEDSPHPSDLARAREQPGAFPQVWGLIRRLGPRQEPRHRLLTCQEVSVAAGELSPPVPPAVVQAALEGLDGTGALQFGWTIDWSLVPGSIADAG